METDGIVERFDVTKDAQSSVGEVGVAFVFGPFMFQGPEEPFHRRVVVAATRAAHRTSGAQRLQRLLVRVARVLTTVGGIYRTVFATA